MNIQLKVTPEVLQAEAEKMTRLCTQMTKKQERMAKVVRRVEAQSRWAGDAADHHKQVSVPALEALRESVKELSECPTRLLIMANLYQETEEAAVTASQEWR